jgi:hypothetical protein
MAYIVEQVRGNLARISNEIREAALENNLDECRRLWESAGAPPVKIERVSWWIYNAPRRIKSGSWATDWKKLRGYTSPRAKSWAICRQLEKRFGGEFRYRWEY